MSDLAVFTGTAIVPGWRWHTAREGLLAPADMETSHLFYTLRMIWNNRMPADARVGDVRLYRFSPQTHSNRYLGEAIMQVGRELAGRPDLTPEMLAQLEQMAAYFRRTKLVAGDHPGPGTLSLGKPQPLLETHDA